MEEEREKEREGERDVVVQAERRDASNAPSSQSCPPVLSVLRQSSALLQHADSLLTTLGFATNTRQGQSTVPVSVSVSAPVPTLTNLLPEHGHANGTVKEEQQLLGSTTLLALQVMQKLVTLQQAAVEHSDSDN